MPRSLKYTDYNQISKLMAEGARPFELFAALNCSEREFYQYLSQDQRLRDTFERGMPKSQTHWFGRFKTALATGDHKSYNYFKDLFKNEFNWNKKEDEVQKTQINIGNITVNNNKSREELIEYIQDEMIDQGLIDINAVKENAIEAEYKLIESDRKD